MAELATWVGRALRTLGWAPAAFVLLHLVLVYVVHVPRHFSPYDESMHLAGGVLIAWFFRRILDLPEADAVMGPLTPLGRDLTALAALGTAAACWEFLEWLSDFLGFTRWQQSVDDTMKDMAFGMGAGALFLIARALRPRPRR